MPFSLKKLDKAKALEVTLDTALKVLETTENVLNTTPIPGVAAVITVILEVVKRQERASTNARRTVEQQERWKKLVSQLEECETDTDSNLHDTLSTLRNASKALASELQVYARELGKATTHEFRPRWMTCGGDEEALQDFLRKSNEAIVDYQLAQGRRIEECVLKIQRVVGGIDIKVDRIENTIQLERDESKIKEFDRLIETRRAPLAAYNAPRTAGTLSSCAEGTRVPLLQTITDWRNDPDGDSVFWLKERAGFGKTAIALSVARQAADESTLAASFFFSYQIPDLSNTSRFLPTIIYQLCLFGGVRYKERFAAAIADHTSLLDAQLKDQMQRLFFNPLTNSNLTPENRPIVIVIDALDECRHEDAQDLTEFITSLSALGLPLKLFITSRPEAQITAPFSKLGVRPRAVVDTSNEDVATYLRAELAKIPGELNSRGLDIPKDWIKEEEIQALLEHAGAKQVNSDSSSTENALFVYIATVVRFLGDTHACDPQGRLRVVLSAVPPSHYRPYQGLDTLYLRVLDVALPNQEDLLQRFHAVVGGIMAVFKGTNEHHASDTRASSTIVETLLDLPWGEVRRTLVNLQSVIQYPDTDSTLPTFHHRSFTDFLTDKGRSGPRYYIDLKPHRKRFAFGCLRIIATCPIKEEVMNAMNKEDYFYPEVELLPEFRHASAYLLAYSESVTGDKDLLEELEKFIRADFGWWIELVTHVHTSDIDKLSDATDPQNEQALPVLFQALAASAKFSSFTKFTRVSALVHKELRRYISAVAQQQDDQSPKKPLGMAMAFERRIHELRERVCRVPGGPIIKSTDMKPPCEAILMFAKAAEAVLDEYQLSTGNQDEVERSRKRTLFLRRQIKPLLEEDSYLLGITADGLEAFEWEGIWTPIST